jgi:L-2,4-diaminobutyrate decarboxylase
MGLCLRSVVGVPSRDWRIDVDALAATLDALARDGRRVLAVVATAGSTATGSFDDLDAIGALCEARGVWLHVDGAHGASALLSEAHAHRVRGLARARSIAWDPHKMLLLPLSAGMVLVRDERDLQGAFAQQAPYLFHGGDEARVWDQGVRSFQCSRRADALKAWVALQRHGRRGLAALYDHLCATTAALHAMLQARADFVPLHAPESNILCFRWVGDGAPAAGDAAREAAREAALDRANQRARERFNRSGAGWITATTLGGRRVLRVTIMNPRTTPAHLARVVDGLAAEARAASEG